MRTDIKREINGQKEQELREMCEQLFRNKYTLIIHSLTIAQMSYRIGRGGVTFADMQDHSLMEVFMNKSAYYIKAFFMGTEKETNRQEAHKYFLSCMEQAGWTYGPEDLKAKSHPHMVSWENLSEEARDEYIFFGAMVGDAFHFFEKLETNYEESLEQKIVELFDRNSISRDFN